MGCFNGIVKDIESTCATFKTSGAEVNAYLYNRADVDITFDNTNKSKITDISQKEGKKGYLYTGIKKNLNAGHSLVSAENAPDLYSHRFTLEQYETLAADIENVDDLKDIVVVYEAKAKTATGEGVFFCLGAKSGLYKSADDLDINASAARTIELTSMAGSEETNSRYTVFLTSYAATKAMLDATLVTGV